MMGGTIIDWAPGVNLREAEEYEVVRARVAQINVAAGTETLNIVTFQPADPFEVLAVGLHTWTSQTGDATSDIVARVGREVQEVVYNVTTRPTFDREGERAGDYFSTERRVRPNQAWEDETNGTGGSDPGLTDEFWSIMDPGQDQAESPLVLQEGEQIRVHSLLGENGIGANEELFQDVALHIWGEEVPEAETDVRTSFPSSGNVTI